MKSILFLTFILFIGMPFNLLAEDNFQEILLVPAPISDVTVLPKYTTRKDVRVWLKGVFSNGCYSWSHTVINMNEKNVFTISLYPIAQFFTGFCTMAFHRYSEVVHLGTLNSGVYKILVQTPDGLFIERNTLIE